MMTCQFVTPRFCNGSVCVLLAAVALGLLLSRPASAQVLDQANGHYYDIIDQAFHWDDAINAAAAHTYNGMQGYLVTITSQQENDFLTNTFGDRAREKWAGAFRTGDGSDPNAGWHWLTGETWDYTNWAPGEPNNAGGVENRMSLKGGGNPLGTWNDTSFDSFSGYIIEYSPTPVPESSPAVSFGLLLALGGVIAACASVCQKKAALLQEARPEKET